MELTGRAPQPTGRIREDLAEGVRLLRDMFRHGDTGPLQPGEVCRSAAAPRRGKVGRRDPYPCRERHLQAAPVDDARQRRGGAAPADRIVQGLRLSGPARTLPRSPQRPGPTSRCPSGWQRAARRGLRTAALSGGGICVMNFGIALAGSVVQNDRMQGLRPSGNRLTQMWMGHANSAATPRTIEPRAAAPRCPPCCRQCRAAQRAPMRRRDRRYAGCTSFPASRCWYRG